MTYTFFVRTSAPLNGAITALRNDAKTIDPAAPPVNTIALEEYTQQSLFTQKIAANLLSILAATAIRLAAVGLYSVMAYSVVRRTNEIGISVTLGARPANIMRMVVVHGLLFGLAGLIAGSVIAIALA